MVIRQRLANAVLCSVRKTEAWNTNGTEVMQPYCNKSSRKRSDPSRSLIKNERENMRCPICNQPGNLVNKVRKITTAAGA